MSALGMLPADQGLGTGDACCAKIHLGLVMQYELLRLDCRAQLADERKITRTFRFSRATVQRKCRADPLRVPCRNAAAQ